MRRRRYASGHILVAILFLLLTALPLLANGGKVRISRAPVGPYFVSVYSSPTPARTGKQDVSVLVQDSADRQVDVPLTLELQAAGGGPARTFAVTRQAATNKLFKAAKFSIDAPGEWVFRIRVGDVGEVSFQATVERSTILDRPYLIAALILLPLLLVGWLVSRRDDAPAQAPVQGRSPGETR